MPTSDRSISRKQFNTKVDSPYYYATSMCVTTIHTVFAYCKKCHSTKSNIET